MEGQLVVDANHVLVFNDRDDMGERKELASQRQDVARRLRPLITAWAQDVDAEALVNEPEAAAAAPSGGRGAAPIGGRSRGGASR